MSYDPGRARHRISIMRNTPTQNEVGEMVPSWALYRRLWAVITQDDGAEAWAGGADQFVNQVVTKFETRLDTTITTEDRISYNGKTFRIISLVDVAEMRRFTRIKGVEAEEAIA